MIGIMTAWMIFFMSLYDRFWIGLALSSGSILTFYYFIRRQSFITKREYYRGMIPHHSMAIFTSRRILDSYPHMSTMDKQFIQNIIDTQEAEIKWMKTRLD